jgi:hypothetical protein
MRLPGPRPRRAAAEHRPAARGQASWRSPALPENACRELPRHPQEVAHLIREPVRKSGALTVRISNWMARAGELDIAFTAVVDSFRSSIRSSCRRQEVTSTLQGLADGNSHRHDVKRRPTRPGNGRRVAEVAHRMDLPIALHEFKRRHPGHYENLLLFLPEERIDDLATQVGVTPATLYNRRNSAREVFIKFLEGNGGVASRSVRGREPRHGRRP